MERPLRVLMLEDIDTDAELVQRELRKADLRFDITRMEEAEAFEAALKLGETDLILADYSLPRFDAISALELAKELAPDVPFILVSGALGEDLAVETLKQGATDYVLKQNLSRLVPSVKRALRETAARVDRRRAEEEVRRLNRELESRVNERTAQLQSANTEIEKVARENERLYKEAQAAVRSRDALLSVASHDLRNLLAAMNGTVKMLQHYVLSGPDIPKSDILSNGVARIGAAATRMNSLISEMLDFAVVQMGQTLELYKRSTDLVSMAHQVVAQNPEAIERHNIRIESATPELVGLWDAPRLERVLDNLLSNAIKYSPKGGNIIVALSRDDISGEPWAVLKVIDRGIGIPDPDLDYIFEWFRRAGNVSGRISGTGIGLASAKQVVEQHGGSISVDSKEGSGSTFTVRLPLTHKHDLTSAD